MKKIVIIDDLQSESQTLAGALESYECFPQTPADYISFWKDAIIPTFKAADTEIAAEGVKKYLDDNKVEPICFVVDVSLLSAGDANDRSGMTLRRVFLQKAYPGIPVVYVTQYSEKLLGDRSDDEGFSLKREVGNEDVKKYLSTNLPHQILMLVKDPKDLEFVRKPAVQNNMLPDSRDEFTIQQDDALKEQKRLKALLAQAKILKGNKALAEKLDLLTWKGLFIHRLIMGIYKLLIVLSVLFLLYYSFFWVVLHWLKDYIPTLEGETKITPFKIIEHVFIAPLPLIILLTFYNYYKSVFVPILSERKERLDEDKKRTAMLDISITKYLFASVLFSTIVVTLLERISNIINKAKGEYELSDSDLISFIASGGLMVLLVFYILKIEKHVSRNSK